MRKTLQKVIGIIALSASLVNHTPAFASEASVDCKECDWHIGLKLHNKQSFKTVMERCSVGLDFAVGPFVEWKPFNQIGIQTGLMYGYNNLLTGGFNWRGHLVNGWSGKATERNTSDSIFIDAALIDVDNVNFQAISIPCAIRFYPGNDRQFALHIGGRFIIPVSKAKRTSYGSMYIGSDEHGPATYFNRMIGFGDAKKNKLNKQDDLEIKSHSTWDVGFDYNTSFGLIIGMNGLGITLGYDCAKCLLK